MMPGIKLSIFREMFLEGRGGLVSETIENHMTVFRHSADEGGYEVEHTSSEGFDDMDHVHA
jgi:hypothetical protein